MLNKFCGMAVAGLFLVSIYALAQAPEGTPGAKGKTGRPQVPGTGGRSPGGGGFPGSVGVVAPGAQGQGRSVADLLARLAQIKQQREALEKEQLEVLARLREELPKEHRALESAEKTVQEYEGEATEKGRARNARGG